CQIRPKYIENGYQHPYCGRTCARNSPIVKGPPCVLAGCRTPGDTTHGGFCSDAHAREAVQTRQVKGCARCRQLPGVSNNQCVQCIRSPRAGTKLRELNPKGATSQSIVSEFYRAWDGNEEPTVVKVIEIVFSRDVRAAYAQYQQNLETAMKVYELNTYHSTQCICDFAVNDLSLCEWQSCGICSIIKSAFGSFAFGATHNSGSYGEGIYSYPNPAQADQWATSSTSSPFRVMLACKVVISAAPQAVNDGAKVVVKTSDAIMPRYVILYTK
ncbi:hypothetical protein POSPLADRAFT_1156269, partial [Postia placenta MAD-698-R-SB12]